jgi:hypothetical protein
MQQIYNQAKQVLITSIVSQSAQFLGDTFGLDPQAIRIAADAYQLFGLFQMAKYARLAKEGGCFAGDTLVETTNHGDQEISQVQLGERVQTGVSETQADGGPSVPQASDTAVDPATWRQVNLTMSDPTSAGDSYNIQLLEPLSWITSYDATAGSEVDLDLPEMNVSGEAEITSITACPVIESGSGQVVLGTFEHVSNDVVDVNLVGESQPLQVTATHEIWSLDTGGWVEAGDLYPGERLAGANGPIVVASVTQDSQAVPVYNLDVENDHRYLVTNLGLLVHNIYPSEPPGQIGGTSEAPQFQSFQTAQTAALNWLKARGFTSGEVTVGKFGTSAGEPNGMTEIIDGKRIGYRIEYDDRSGAHINVFDFTEGGDGKGPHFLFPGNGNAVNSILNQLFGG